MDYVLPLIKLTLASLFLLYSAKTTDPGPKFSTAISVKKIICYNNYDIVIIFFFIVLTTCNSLR